MFSTYDMDMFSKKILEFRKRLGYSRECVSKMSGINSDTIRKIEIGEVIPRFETLEILSQIYKVNLLQLLDQHKSSTTISYYYDSIDYYIARNETTEILNIINEFNDFKKNGNSPLLLNPKEIEQLSLFFKAFELLYSDQSSKYKNSLELLTNAIKVTIHSFKVDNWNTFVYTHLETRILYCIASTLIYIDLYQLSIDILKSILKILDSTKNSNLNEKYIIIKTYSLISYNYHMLDLYEMSLTYANMGIDFCQKNCIMHNLPLLLSRKGVALHNLKDMNFIVYLEQAVQLLRIQNNHALADIYLNVNSKYTFDIFV